MTPAAQSGSHDYPPCVISGECPYDCDEVVGCQKEQR